MKTRGFGSLHVALNVLFAFAGYMLAAIVDAWDDGLAIGREGKRGIELPWWTWEFVALLGIGTVAASAVLA